MEKVALTEVGPVHAKAPTFDGNSHWGTNPWQFEASELLKSKILLVLVKTRR